jgi:hypothetical protein
MWTSRSNPERRGEWLMRHAIGAGADCSCESREFVLLDLPWSTASSTADSFEDDTGRVRESEGGGEACNSLSSARAWASGVVYSDDCVEGCTTVSSSEVDTTIVWALLECSLLDCSSPEFGGSVSDSESELSSSERCEFRMGGTASAASAA